MNVYDPRPQVIARTPDHRDAALECLRLACGHSGDVTPQQVVERARAYLAFALGEPEQSPIDQIRKILDRLDG